MTRIVSWNISGRQNLWQAAANLKSELNVDALLLQEAPRPPADLDISVDLETPWKDIMPKSPARKVKLLEAHITPPRILTIDEQNVYLMACAQPLRDVASLMIELGLRPSEILNLKRDDISLRENCLQVQEGKTKNARRKLPLSIESRKVLEYRLQTIEGESLFPNVKVVRLDQLHKKALKALGIKIFTDNYFVLYSLRHCFASRHTENQTDPITLSELLGHGDLKTLKRYAHPSFEHKTQAIKRVEKLNAKAV